MSLPSLPASRAWIAAPLLALAFLLWAHATQRARVLHVTAAVPTEARPLATSPTGYAGGIRRLVLPPEDTASAHWIAQTQDLLAGGPARVRHIAYENAPFGRAVPDASAYRGWLGLVACTEHWLSGRPLGQSVEQAALLADPLWHLLLLLAATGFTAWRFGLRPAAWLSLGVVCLYPFGAGFQPGLPDDETLLLAGLLAQGLLLLAGLDSARNPVRWFLAAGGVGGACLWLDAAAFVPVVLGPALGALLAVSLARRQPAPPGHASPPWLAWALGGGAGSLGFYLVEYFPGHLGSWQLRTNHPLYALAWLGLGAALVLATDRLRHAPAPWTRRQTAVALFALAALAPLPVILAWQTDLGFLAVEPRSFRLTRLPGSPEAAHLLDWISRGGLSAPLGATLLPLTLAGLAGWLLLRRDGPAVSRTVLAVALGPVLLGALFAAWQTGRWADADAALLVLLVPVARALWETIRPSFTRFACAGLLGLMLVPGLVLLWPSARRAPSAPLDDAELAALIARDLAHWLAQRRPPDQPAIVLAPPGETAALHYYGGLPGLATLAWENQAGLAAAVRILSATSPQEAHALIKHRGVTHLVIPSWDRYLPEYVRLGGSQADETFHAGLRHWALPPWLHPVAYTLPGVPGYENQTVAVFVVVEEQEEVLSLGRLAEYFAETGRLDLAAQVGESLRRFPADLGANIARARVALARRDGAGVTEALQAIGPRLDTSAGRWLPWDRRVSLALVLAQTRQTELARARLQTCLAEARDADLRALSSGELYRLMLLAGRFALEYPDPHLRATARALLPAEARDGGP